MKILAFILDQKMFERILHHIGEEMTPLYPLRLQGVTQVRDIEAAHLIDTGVVRVRGQREAARGGAVER
jgi:hypothetical protein